MKKIIALLFSVMMVATLITGCGKNDASKEDTSKTENGNEQTEGAKEESGKKTLTVTTWDNDTTPQFSATIKAFEEKHPDVKVEVIDTSADEYNNKLTVMLAAESKDPDVIWVKDMGSLLSMASKKQLLELNDFITKDNLDLSVYSGAAEQLQVEGKSYSLPYRSDWYVLYYNKDIFDKAGVSYPSNDMTWTEYEELARKLTSGEGSEKIYGTHNHTWQALVTNWAIQDGKNSVVAKDYSFLKPYYEQAVRMQKDGIIQDYATLKTANIHYSSVFKNQQTAMMPMGTWFIGTMMQSQASGETNFNWGFATIPHPEGVKAGSTVGALTPIAIGANTDVPDLAWEFVKFAASEENSKTLAENGILSGIQSEESFDIIASAENFPSECKDALKYTNYVFDRPLDEDIDEIRTVLDEEHDLIMIGEYTIDEGLKELQERVAEIKGF